MKIKFILLTLISLISTGLFAQKKPTKAEIDASNTISFANTVIDLGNYYLANLENYSGVFSSAESNLKKLKTNPNIQLFAVNCINLSEPNTSLEQAYNVEVQKPITFTEKEDVKAAVTDAKANIKKVNESCTLLSDYFSKKEYASDTDFTKYEVLVENLKANIFTANNSWMLASQLASDAGSKAEIELLAGSKIADFIIPMKTDLGYLNKILDQLQMEEVDTASLKTQIASLSESVTKNKDITTKNVSKLSDFYYQEVYVDFYKNIEDCIGYLNTIITRIESDQVDEDLNNQFRYMSSKYGNAIEKYNTFISQ